MPISISRELFADLFPLSEVPPKYLDSPLLEERTAYISHLLQQGLSRTRIKEIASMQINAIKLLDMTEARPIYARELQQASSRWAIDTSLHKTRRPGKTSFQSFSSIVKNWLTFSDLYVKPGTPALPLDPLVKSYLEELQANGLATTTIHSRAYVLSQFQKSLGVKDNLSEQVSLNDIENYLSRQREKGWCQETLRSVSRIFRYFFRFCEARGWCRPGIARGIMMPRVIKAYTGPRGPTWKDVRRMLRIVGSSPAELRAKAVISLVSIYALRRSEVIQLRLNDIDWYNELMTVRRAKRGRPQQFPIQYEVGQAILAYLRTGRPKTSCRNLFTTLRVPFRPMGPFCVAQIVAKRMRELGIESHNFGPHALRHSCATQLLDRGFSLQEIADFLGHRGLASVSVYAKYNPRLLRGVASISLAGMK